MQVWERGEIVMCITVPDTCILAKSNQLIKYSSPSKSQTEALKQKSNTTSLFVVSRASLFLLWVAIKERGWLARLSLCHAA